ncbi:polysaccharide deacetylase family protein [Geofilum rubicundum]|uniref:DUF7033 domain-containing protein n=1 Tax=Geofilum rubicundum JCM 15548 TaxID=1236989 RepID=A0A0E9LWV1_9BACT|nr:polysaccharide deacetylase family protein [Geofilum rubicundum]GAO29729.1 hypothetical protein JCM15548_11949 [Geofilum rubicundum JCM 15548]
MGLNHGHTLKIRFLRYVIIVWCPSALEKFRLILNELLIFVAMHLSQNKIHYLFDHLQQHWVPDKRVTEAFVIIGPHQPVPQGLQGKIVFRLSGQDQPQPVNVNVEGQDIPVLFPLSESSVLYQMDESGNLWFSHDYLSSAFYVLSGLQELREGHRDAYGRFQYAGSIQNRYNIVSKPVVNYYFECLLKGFEAFGQLHDLPIKRRRLFDNFGFLLSHDVDRVSFHHPRLMIYKVLQIIGLKINTESKSKLFKQLLSGLRFHLNLWGGKDPWWNFRWMMDVEKRLGIRSSFFFLAREEGTKNAWFNFSSKKIKHLISELKSEEFEVGIHGTFKSVTDGPSLQKQKAALSKVSGEAPAGIRQHYLLFSHPTTFKIQEAAGLVYDSTLSFHDHDGYRNGYCYPFRPYDFEKDVPMQIWEIPLVMMEVSALQYRQLSFAEIETSVLQYVQEAQKFGGLFSLLWHNCRLNNDEYNGVTDFYMHLLQQIMEYQPLALTGIGCVRRAQKALNDSAISHI